MSPRRLEICREIFFFNWNIHWERINPFLLAQIIRIRGQRSCVARSTRKFLVFHVEGITRSAVFYFLAREYKSPEV